VLEHSALRVIAPILFDPTHAPFFSIYANVPPLHRCVGGWAKAISYGPYRRTLILTNARTCCLWAL